MEGIEAETECKRVGGTVCAEVTVRWARWLSFLLKSKDSSPCLQGLSCGFEVTVCDGPRPCQAEELLASGREFPREPCQGPKPLLRRAADKGGCPLSPRAPVSPEAALNGP